MKELNHLAYFETYKHGPIQKDEALFLYAVCKMIRPKTILEFGIQDGLSTLNFALAKDKDCFLFSFDIKKDCVNRAFEKIKEIENCFLLVKDCQEFSVEDVKNRPIDLCFLDAAHILEINKKCIRKFIPHMSDTGIIAIHDTGAWSKEACSSFPSNYKISPRMKTFLDDKETRFLPAVASERLTVNWFLEEYPEYSQIHFHSATFFRHGITLIQKKGHLPMA